jgi:hypothetical protein
MSQTALLALQPLHRGRSSESQTCLYTWQDQSNLHKKGGTHVNMRSLLLSLEATERVCRLERSNGSVVSCDKKPSHSDQKGTCDLVLEESQSPEEKLVPRKTATFARSMGARTRCTMLAIAVVLRKKKRNGKIRFPCR